MQVSKDDAQPANAMTADANTESAPLSPIKSKEGSSEKDTSKTSIGAPVRAVKPSKKKDKETNDTNESFKRTLARLVKQQGCKYRRSLSIANSLKLILLSTARGIIKASGFYEPSSPSKAATTQQTMPISGTKFTDFAYTGWIVLSEPPVKAAIATNTASLEPATNPVESKAAEEDSNTSDISATSSTAPIQVKPVMSLTAMPKTSSTIQPHLRGMISIQHKRSEDKKAARAHIKASEEDAKLPITPTDLPAIAPLVSFEDTLPVRSKDLDPAAKASDDLIGLTYVASPTKETKSFHDPNAFLKLGSAALTSFSNKWNKPAQSGADERSAIDVSTDASLKPNQGVYGYIQRASELSNAIESAKGHNKNASIDKALMDKTNRSLADATNKPHKINVGIDFSAIREERRIAKARADFLKKVNPLAEESVAKQVVRGNACGDWYELQKEWVPVLVGGRTVFNCRS